MLWHFLEKQVITKNDEKYVHTKLYETYLSQVM